MRARRPAFTLQALRTPGRADLPPRIGFTVTKKVGTAVVRNRIKRRLRALADQMAGAFASGTDYVVVARAEARTAPFAALGQSLQSAVREADGKLSRPRGKKHEPASEGGALAAQDLKQRVVDG